MAEIVEMPKLGFDMAEGTLVKWVKSEKDTVEKGDVLAEIETDKATVEVESSFSGIVYKHLAEVGQVLPVGTPIAVVAAEGEEVNLEQLTGKSVPKVAAQKPRESGEESGQKPVDQEIPAPEASESQPAAQSDEMEFIKASPLAKRMAAEKDLDLAVIKGTGPGGRIVKRDVQTALEKGSSARTEKQEMPAIVSAEDQTFEMSKLRTAIGKRMLESRQTIPDFYVTYSFDAGSLMQMREQMNRELPEDERLSVNDYIIRAAALALREFPNLNASLNGNDLTRHGDVNIGSAVAVKNGLLTVVVRNADQKPLKVISTEMKEMVARVKDGKVRNEDIEGSTFTISNLGMFGVEDFVAIINPPEAAILAVGGALQVPVIQNGQVVIGWQMKATLSADHRITDGAEAAQFMQRLAVFLEQPWRLI